MKIKFLKPICLLLLFCTFTLNSCGPSLEFQHKKSQGLYPDTTDFPCTKWHCNEIDMEIYMLGFGETTIIGSYIVDDNVYRVVAYFEWNELIFNFYSNTLISSSQHSNSMVHCERISSGHILSAYSFDKSTETIVCSLRNYKPVASETIPETLTFNNVEAIAQNPDTRWYAQEMDMYLDSFTDANEYFRGEIFIDGKRCSVHAFEMGNNNFFMLSIRNGEVNNLLPNTTSMLIPMYFEISENQIIAKVSDEYLSNAVAFPYWSYDDIIITFKPLVA